MIDDIKMIELFPESFGVDHNKSFAVQNCHWVTFGVDYHSNCEQDDAIAHAVLNHDRLVEENKRLWEFVKKVAELEIETFHFEMRGGDEDFIEYICTDIVDDANDLLSSLDCGAQGSSSRQELKPLEFFEIGRLEK